MNLKIIAAKLAEIEAQPPSARPKAVQVLRELILDNISNMQGRILEMVSNNPGIQAKTIADELGKDHSYITRELRNIEYLGLVRKDTLGGGHRWQYKWYFKEFEE